MNCGALCKGLSNNNTLTNLAVFGSDVWGMIDILQLNATKKSLTRFSFSVCILSRFLSNLSMLIVIYPKQQSRAADYAAAWAIADKKIADCLKDNDSLTKLRLVRQK